MEQPKEIRNIAIIAHVDHGKTTLTDAIMRQCGMFEEGMSMDTNALERERGITIYSKNTSVFYKHTKINIVDTPGHADFGSEVERVLRSIDAVLLIVDAQEGPMPQTRFVLKKALEVGLKPIVVVNKIDKPGANIARTEDEVLELFINLGANDAQLDFVTLYAIGREGVVKRALDDEFVDLSPLLDIILEVIPAALSDREAPLRAQPFNLAYDNYVGRLAIARVYEGTIHVGDTVYIKHEDSGMRNARITKLFTFRGLNREETNEAVAGDIVMIAGIADIDIGETICGSPDAMPLPSIKVDEPTIALNFMVNNSPFCGREGKFVTSRQIGDRLKKELEVNIGLYIDFSEADKFRVYGRGELHIAILLETMRREGYELQVSQPQIITKEIDGVLSEPFEEITIDIPSIYQGIIIERLSQRKARLISMDSHEVTLRMVFEGPTRGILGYRSQFVIDTKGEGIFASRVIGFRPYSGDIVRKHVGSMVSMITGKTLAYSLDNLQTRGQLYIEPNTEVYEGMVIGNTSKGDEMPVNPTKGKQLTNMRASGSDDSIFLEPAWKLTIERGLEVMDEDEYLEITPYSTRLRKIYLTENERSKHRKKA
ncbi:MAG: translational GTPase TypA [Patescibacteria group bacterium]|nr:translational GTPase TypA [Patescibacteria group bacterium]MDE2437773.1 translational GTPase TypA [Patescibacteria group bacterium]